MEKNGKGFKIPNSLKAAFFCEKIFCPPKIFPPGKKIKQVVRVFF